MENRFCFVAIVKNESHVIRRCIDSIANMATSYLICDTGSTDNTPEIIAEYANEKNIPGEVIHKEWINYAENRSYLYDQAYTFNKACNAKYLIWHDADEVFVTDPNDPLSYPTREDADKLFEWLESKSHAITYIQTVYGSLKYRRWNIVKNNQLYIWKSPKHEWLSGTIDNSGVTYHEFVLLARQQGAASRDPNRCLKDSMLFLDYISENGGANNCPREVFYLAQESESFDRDQAIKYYISRTRITSGYSQEIYISYLRLGRLCTNVDDKIKYWSAGYNFQTERLECIYELMNHYKCAHEWKNAFEWAMCAPETRVINDLNLFNEPKIYEYMFDLNFAVVAHYYNRNQLASDINTRLISRCNPNNEHMNLILTNQKFFDLALKNNDLIKLIVNK